MTLDLSNLVLKTGSHESREAGMCAMEAVAWLANEPHSDEPSCACPVIAAYVRVLNDRMPDDQRQRLVKYLPALIGTNDPTKLRARAELLAWAAIRQFAPPALRAVGLIDHADTLENFQGSLNDATHAADAADADAYYATDAARAATHAADAAAYYATDAAAAYAARAATHAARAAIHAAARVAAPVWDVALTVLSTILA